MLKLKYRVDLVVLFFQFGFSHRADGSTIIAIHQLTLLRCGVDALDAIALCPHRGTVVPVQWSFAAGRVDAAMPIDERLSLTGDSAPAGQIVISQRRRVSVMVRTVLQLA